MLIACVSCSDVFLRSVMSSPILKYPIIASFSLLIIVLCQLTILSFPLFVRIRFSTYSLLSSSPESNFLDIGRTIFFVFSGRKFSNQFLPSICFSSYPRTSHVLLLVLVTLPLLSISTNNTFGKSNEDFELSFFLLVSNFL